MGLFASVILGLVCLGPPVAAPPGAAETGAALELRPDDRIAILGNAFAERLGRFGHFEALLRGAAATTPCTVRVLGWSGDTVSLRPRPLNFGDLHEHLERVRADVVLLCFGMNEAFDGPAGRASFERDLVALIAELRARDYSGRGSPRLALVSPIPHEDLGPPLPDPAEHEAELAALTEVMRRVAREHDLAFADLHGPLRALRAAGGAPLTFNGIHVTERGAAVCARVLAEQLGVRTDSWRLEVDVAARTAGGQGVDVHSARLAPDEVALELSLHALPAPGEARSAAVRVRGLASGSYGLVLNGRQVARARHTQWANGVSVTDPAEARAAEELRLRIVEKDCEFFRRWRPVNGEYVFGRRAEPFGVVSFPPEMRALDERIAAMDEAIAQAAAAARERSLRLVRLQ